MFLTVLERCSPSWWGQHVMVSGARAERPHFICTRETETAETRLPALRAHQCTPQPSAVLLNKVLPPKVSVISSNSTANWVPSVQIQGPIGDTSHTSHNVQPLVLEDYIIKQGVVQLQK